MSSIVIVGAQWGDEGKGKVVDVVAEAADLVVRFAGGSNAGHTLVVGDKKIVTNLVPSGCSYPGTGCVLAAGMVIDPDRLQQEVAVLQGHGLLQDGELSVSLDAHVVWPFHRQLDGLREDKSAAGKIGTTRRGIGPAYEAKAARRGIRIRDLFARDRLRSLLEQNKEALEPELQRLGGRDGIEVEALLAKGDSWARWLEPLVCDTGDLVHAALRAGNKVLFEGAQGSLLDLDHGTYPFITSSSTVAGGACTGVGIGPTLIDQVWGIAKAYATRVGSGPFPTRLDDGLGQRLRDAGGEYGAVTGRPRECGWLDLPALRFAARINGLTGLCITKIDVLAQLEEIMVCTAYRDGLQPGRDRLDDAIPVLTRVQGWGEPRLAEAVCRARSMAELPSPVRRYLELVSESIEVPVVLVSTGPDRSQTILTGQAF